MDDITVGSKHSMKVVLMFAIPASSGRFLPEDEHEALTSWCTEGLDAIAEKDQDRLELCAVNLCQLTILIDPDDTANPEECARMFRLIGDFYTNVYALPIG